MALMTGAHEWGVKGILLDQEQKLEGKLNYSKARQDGQYALGQRLAFAVMAINGSASQLER
jgi:hypothetical protein